MDIHIKHKRFSVVFIPDYVVSTLAIKGKTLNDIDAAVGKLGTDYLQGIGYANRTNGVSNSMDMNRDKADYLTTWLDKNLSKNDIKDMIILNDLGYDYLLNHNNVSYKDEHSGYVGTNLYTNTYLNDAVNSGFDAKITAELITHYTDKEKDVNTIILSRDTEADKALWSTVITENTLFVVVNPGFTNFISLNIMGFKEYFVTRLVDCLFKMFGEDAVVNDRIFKSLIRLHK